MANEQSLNQILYGPPGTGKTYETINLALKIIDNDIPESREDAKKRFDELKEAGQIEFVTFHQSYGYEEFVEGIKPCDLENCEDENSDVKYQVADGVFKRLSDIAKNNYENSTIKTEEELNFEQKINKLLNLFNKYLYNLFEKGEEFKLNDKATIQDINSRNGYKLGGSVSNATLSQKIIRRDYKKFVEGLIKTNDDILPSRESNQLSIGNSYYYYALLKKLKEFEDNNIDELNTTKIENEKLKNYILIIDEINRGNISKIFGELITLIEDNKRIGANEEMRVTLPYSGESFGVPNNLYIIGTMNTADRSIALMDTALRRRFEFVEMMPNPCLLYSNEARDLNPNEDPKNDLTNMKNWNYKDKNNDNYFFKDLDGYDLIIDGINLRSLLYAINQRIEYLYDRDHMIGHSYFMGIENKDQLDNVMKNKIIPLLQEYFYDDWEKIQMVLGDHKEQKADDSNKFIISKKLVEKDIFGFEHEDIEDNQMNYTINEKFTRNAYTKIYTDINSDDETQTDSSNRI